MKNIWRWIIGIIVGLVIVALLLTLVCQSRMARISLRLKPRLHDAKSPCGDSDNTRLADAL
jgi:hypothetical protein